MTDSQVSAGSELEIRRGSTIDTAALEELENALLSGVAPAEVEVNPEEVQRNLIRALLAAESDEELERVEAEGWENYEGHPFEILDFVWRPSTFDEGQPVFLVVRAISTVDGSPHVLTTGSAQVMAQLANLAKRGRLPAIRELVSAETKSKRTVHHLKTPDSLAEQRRQEALAARTGGGEQPAPGDA